MFRNMLILTFFLHVLIANAAEVVVKGTVSNFPADAEYSLAQIGINELPEGQRPIRREVDSLDNFELRFEMEHTQDVWFRFATCQFQLLLSPGDDLTITIDYEKLPASHILDVVVFEGEKAELNRLFVQMMEEYWNTIDFGAGENLRMGNHIKELQPLEFLSFRLKKQQEEEHFFKKFTTYHSIDEPLLLSWIEQHLIYQTASDLMMYTVFHPKFNNIARSAFQLDDSYYNFLEKIPLNNPAALICGDYYQFIGRDYFFYKINEPFRVETNKEKLKGANLVKLTFDHLMQMEQGIAKEALLTQFLLNTLDIPDLAKGVTDSIVDAYNNVVQTERFKNDVFRKYSIVSNKEPVEVQESANLLSIPPTDEDVLSTIAQDNAGKVIYVDVWATWCGPCVAEMKHYAKLLEQYKDKDISFVFLAFQSPENMWKKFIKDYQLDAIHYMLSEKQYHGMEKHIELKGFPQHILIDKTGKIITDKAAHLALDDGSINPNLLSEIDGLLKQ